jgi:hypothetical protein
VWRTGDGVDWRHVGFAGFGGSSSMLPFWDNSTAVFGQSLCAGTWNYASGGEVWI